jgi:glycosyltransferase involved in cell wall biosynthesis
VAEPGSVDLSVILPAYQAEAFIGTALKSVLDQVPAGRTVEIVVVDDGSTDGTAEVVAGFGESGPVRYFRQENQGPSVARNLALSHARGRLFMLLDGDDVICPGCIQTTLDFMDSHPEVGMFFTNYDLFDETGVVVASGVDLWQRFRGLAHREVAPGEWVFVESLTPHIVEAGGFMHTSGLTFRREVYARVGPFREGFSYGEDDEFYARLAHETTAGYVDRVLSRKRNHPGSLIHDPANAVRNDRHLLELSEIQLDCYRSDPQIVEILHRKIPRLVVGWCWGMVKSGRGREARAALSTYMRRYPGCLGLYRLWLRSWLPA